MFCRRSQAKNSSSPHLYNWIYVLFKTTEITYLRLITLVLSTLSNFSSCFLSDWWLRYKNTTLVYVRSARRSQATQLNVQCIFQRLFSIWCLSNIYISLSINTWRLFLYYFKIEVWNKNATFNVHCTYSIKHKRCNLSAQNSGRVFHIFTHKYHENHNIIIHKFSVAVIINTTLLSFKMFTFSN